MKQVQLEIFAIYFSNYSAHAIDIEGVVYPTVEHVYHCMRYDDEKVTYEILQVKSPYLAWQLSQNYKLRQV